ncbi:isomerase [Sulfitobacter sp. JL08]|uniref:sugar phosphate isomerase/epimerase family protein n=1 Tax=Sulfitobacter sp. JL08 TaxID=2070369 RepID=UPI000E0A6482|nr:sugar phosphate isomerase/epimerase family protein [Sulfitobacter sp. JL08]AXI53628.1 isomerase [Sulfitobacter sp. JL08]
MLAGFNLLLWGTHLTDDLMPKCQAVRDAGYDGVEIPIFEGSAPDYRAIGQRLSDMGLRRTAVAVVQSEMANPISDQADHREAGIDFLKWMVDCAAEAGVETLCGPFFQPLAVFSGTGATRAEWDRLVTAHKAMADHAAGTGVALAVEPLNRFECYALNTLDQSARLVEQVGAEHYGCLFDTFHANIEERDVGAAIRAAGPAINHVHVSENDRGAPGAGHMNFAEAFAALKSTGYDGWLVVEAFGHALPDLAAATRVWRPLFKDEQDVLSGGIRTIRDGWAAA